MITVITFPEVRRADFRAVAYGCQNVVVYDDRIDARKAVWNETSLDAATFFMEAVNEYLDACGVHQERPSRETEARMSSCFLSLPTHMQNAALGIAKTRGVA